MIVDTSAMIAILANENERNDFIDLISNATECSMAAPSVLETTIVLAKFGKALPTKFRLFLREAGITTVTFDDEQLAAAEDAHRRFGRLSGHRAKLNFGECFSYAASAVTGRPLLFKGDDFAHTDVLIARP